MGHRLESLKLIERHNPHGKDLYGAGTIEGISRLEVRPHDRRVFCMAVTTDGKGRGRPSSWSASSSARRKQDIPEIVAQG